MIILGIFFYFLRQWGTLGDWCISRLFLHVPAVNSLALVTALSRNDEVPTKLKLMVDKQIM